MSKVTDRAAEVKEPTGKFPVVTACHLRRQETSRAVRYDFFGKNPEFLTNRHLECVSLHVATRHGGPTEMPSRFIGFFPGGDDQSDRIFPQRLVFPLFAGPHTQHGHGQNPGFSCKARMNFVVLAA
ncbi:MAG: hypothetical protein MUF86_07640 [Akkermansiaceae bacterium]|nr:hypothetical protein [Akkermansiaceae bacterium]